jgi:maleate cis-trans isomerase
MTAAFRRSRLKNVGANKVVVATAYNDDVNARLHAFLTEHGLDVRAVRGWKSKPSVIFPR